jgi:ABC-type Fe3+ transport system permease subunit
MIGTRVRTLLGSRWFYIGLPVLNIVIGLVMSFDALVAAAINGTYHPVASANRTAFIGSVFLALAAAGAASFLAIAIARFVFRSP